ncbi:MAG: hypothetical protein AB4290_12490 [Spirulina sp.]
MFPQKNLLSPSLILVSALTLGVSSTSLLGVEKASAATIATTIDFESGFSDGDSVSTVSAGGTQVTFSVGSGTTGGSDPATIAEVGFPLTGFYPTDGQGTAIESSIGNFFLTDTFGTAHNYFMEFDQLVSSLSVDLLDFRAEGSIVVGDTVTLNVFSDLFSTNIGSATFTITSGLPDPNLEPLLVNLSDNLIRSASIIQSGEDGGTGIDNIMFEREIKDVPDPSSLLGLFVLGTLALSSKSFRQQKS